MVKIVIDKDSVKHLNAEVFKQLMLKVFGRTEMENIDREKWKYVLICELNRRNDHENRNQ